MWCFWLVGFSRYNIGAPGATRPRTISGSLVPVLLGDIGLETPYEPSIWTIPPLAPGHLSGDQYRGSGTTPHRCLTLLWLFFKKQVSGSLDHENSAAWNGGLGV
jgi:hypothetical protein